MFCTEPDMNLTDINWHLLNYLKDNTVVPRFGDSQNSSSVPWNSINFYIEDASIQEMTFKQFV